MYYRYVPMCNTFSWIFEVYATILIYDGWVTVTSLKDGIHAADFYDNRLYYYIILYTTTIQADLTSGFF